MKKLIIVLFVSFMAISTRSQQLEIQIGASKTELKNNAITIGLTYLKSFDSLWGNEQFITGNNSFFRFAPEMDIRTGTEDAFSSIIIKASGLLYKFKTVTTPDGLVDIDYNKTYHIFPINAGIETSNQFNNINGILEVGWLPYYQSYARNSPNWLKKTNIAFFLQAGYKFKSGSVDSTIGGQIDESEEVPEHNILRIKGSAGINTGELVKINGLKMGLVGDADVWADILNGAIYHKIEAKARIFLSSTQYLDFIYSRGSGAPLFNLSSQYGVGLTMQF